MLPFLATALLAAASVDLPPIGKAPSFVLTSHEGARWASRDLKGKVWNLGEQRGNPLGAGDRVAVAVRE